MLLDAPPPDPFMKMSKMFISVPRRIAAKALVERLRAVEPDFRDEIALRMGHGVKGMYMKQCISSISHAVRYCYQKSTNPPTRELGLSLLAIWCDCWLIIQNSSMI